MRKKKKPIKLTYKVEVFLFKYRYFIGAFLFINAFPSINFITKLSTTNEILMHSTVIVTFVVLCTFFFFTPTFRKVYSISTYGSVLLIVILMLTMSIEHIILRGNAYIGIQDNVNVKGDVLNVCKSRNKSKISYSLTIKQQNNENINFNISKLKYENTKIGDTYNEIWKKGSLGILYKSKS